MDFTDRSASPPPPSADVSADGPLDAPLDAIADPTSVPSIDRRLIPAQPRRAIDAQVAAVLESVTHGFLALDADWRITYANSAALALSGAPADSLIGQIHWDVWPETRGSQVETCYRTAVAEQRSTHFEHYYPERDVWHEIHAFPTKHGGLAVVYRDVTEEHAAAAARDRYAAALAARERELAVILETATDAVVRFDRDLRVTFANAAVSRATGLPTHELLGRTPDMLGLPTRLGPRDLAPLRALLDSPNGDEPPVLLTFELQTPHGRRWFEAQAVLEPGGAGRARALLVVARDVTARIRAEQATAHALAVAEAANRAKSEFLATMSHELRTPLNAIRGYAELIALGIHGPVTDEQRECLARIQRSERHLLDLITEILDYARIEAGRITYESSVVPVRPLLEDVVSWMERHALAKGVRLCAAVRDVAVCGDVKRVRQIVVNLLSNALKFTPAGGVVTLRSEARAEAAGEVDGPPRDYVFIEVEDTGPGIDAAAQDRIFLPFVQLARAQQNPIGGVGLGLAISREFARGMGGDLVVRSAPGHGSTFILRLPRSDVCE